MDSRDWSPIDQTGAKLVLTRPRVSWVDRLCAYSVFLDDEYVGKVRNGETAAFPLRKAGQHTLEVRVDRRKESTPATLHSESDDVCYSVRPSGFNNGLQAFYRAVRDPKNYLTLTRE